MMENVRTVEKDNANILDIPPKKRTNLGMVFGRLVKDKVSLVCMIILLLLVLCAAFAPLISPYPFDEIQLSEKLSGPSLKHLCGTDELGRDLLSRLIYGSRNSLLIGVVTTILAMAVGVTLGLVCGYVGKTYDIVIMRIMDIIQAIPNTLLAIAISASLGIGLTNSVIALAIGRIPTFARMARAASLNVVGMEYVEAAKAMNVRSGKILFRHVFPNALSPLIVQGTMSVAGTVMASAGLSFIGLGVQPPQAEWGCMLSAGRTFLRSNPHMVIVPLIAILILVLSCNLLGDGLRDALDPKLKK